MGAIKDHELVSDNSDFPSKNVEDISNGWIMSISLHLQYALRIYLGGVYSSCNYHRIIKVKLLGIIFSDLCL